MKKVKRREAPAPPIWPSRRDVIKRDLDAFSTYELNCRSSALSEWAQREETACARLKAELDERTAIAQQLRDDAQAVEQLIEKRR